MRITYHRAADLDEALSVLAAADPPGVPLAGGTDLMPDIRAGLVNEATLIDLWRIAELRQTAQEQDGIRIGALVTAAELGRSPAALGGRTPALATAASMLGSPQIRSRATIGGNLIHASPAADVLVALVGLRATVSLVSAAGGHRSVPLEELHVGPGATQRRLDELVHSVLVDPGPGARSVFVKVGLRRSLACAVVNAAVSVTLGEDRPGRAAVRDATIALGAVAPTCIRAREAEKLLVGEAPDAELVREVAERAAAECRPIDDVRASSAYRRHLVRVWVGRALTQALWGPDAGQPQAGSGQEGGPGRDSRPEPHGGSRRQRGEEEGRQ